MAAPPTRRPGQEPVNCPRLSSLCRMILRNKDRSQSTGKKGDFPSSQDERHMSHSGNVGSLQSQAPEQEDKMEKQTQREDTHANLSRTQQCSVCFCPSITDSSSTVRPLSLRSSIDIPLNRYLPSPHISGIAIATIPPKPSQSAVVDHLESEGNLGVDSFIDLKKTTLSFHGSELAAIGEGEDYFLSLFGGSKKPIAHSSHTKKSRKHFSGILDEVGQSRTSALGDIKITEVKDSFMRLVNSSLDKELEVGNHTLQQNVNGQAVASYRFPPDITMPANSTVTVWAATSKGKHQPPSDFIWEEENKFRTSPNCTTILCKPNGMAITWYTPINWKQAWQKLDTDIEFERCSIVGPTTQTHMFHWPKATTTTKENYNQPEEDISYCQMGPVPVFLKREKEVPPTLFPNRSPWCHSPNVAAHPYCPLIEPHSTNMAKRSLTRKPKPHPARVPKEILPHGQLCVDQPMETDEGEDHSMDPGKENMSDDPKSNATSRGAEGSLPSLRCP